MQYNTLQQERPSETCCKGLKERGESKSCQEGNLTMTAWQDSKVVTVAATNSNPTVEEQVTRKDEGTSIAIMSPQSVSLYNKFMGGVDYDDQLRGYYHVRLKCRKFYKYIFWFLFDVAVTNAFILCKHYTDLGITDVRSFREKLAKALISSWKHPGLPSLSLTPSKRFCTAHFPVKGDKK